jgi:beclin 1
MCDECAVELSEILSRQIKNYQAETDQYQQYLNSHPDQIDATFFQNLSNQLNEQEQLIHNLETEQQQTDLEIKSHLLKLAEIKIQEKEYFKKLNILDMEVREFDDQFESTNLQLKSAKERLDQLQNTNVYNDAFRIWHNGPFGTINDLRLGRLDNIEWQEINAGIGLAVLLLDSLAIKVGFVFKGYKLLPMGSVSKIEKIDGDRVSYGLYGSSDFTGLFSNRRYNR